MFQPEASITHVPVTKEQVVAIVESINQPQVSIPGKASQQTAGWLVGIRNTNGTLSLFVGLHLSKTGENVIYLPEARHVTVEAYRELEIEGLHFLESMGFMLDNLNFRNLAGPQQDETMARIPLFHPPRPPSSAPSAGGTADRTDAGEGAAIARFLASF
ncbi:MAG TPA: hypothetical protein VLT47_06410 [Anaeromyxobacteraceae bacterium]|nr:hypothetical protein [Anaeromyxobacteraceae bacterium]